MRILLVPLFVAILFSSCAQQDHTKIKVAWEPGYAYVPVCKPLVKYQGSSFEVQGVKIPIPALGGNAEVGGVKVDPKVLNQAYQTTQTLDTYYHSTCALLPSYATDKKKFEKAVENMQDSQTKLAQLALSLQGAQQPSSGPEAPVMMSATATVAPNPETPVSTSPTIASRAAPRSAGKSSAAKRKLEKWVASYAKKDKAAIVNTPAKPNTALDLPPAKPHPSP